MCFPFYEEPTFLLKNKKEKNPVLLGGYFFRRNFSTSMKGSDLKRNFSLKKKKDFKSAIINHKKENKKLEAKGTVEDEKFRSDALQKSRKNKI